MPLWTTVASSSLLASTAYPLLTKLSPFASYFGKSLSSESVYTRHQPRALALEVLEMLFLQVLRQLLHMDLHRLRAVSNTNAYCRLVQGVHCAGGNRPCGWQEPREPCGCFWASVRRRTPPPRFQSSAGHDAWAHGAIKAYFLVLNYDLYTRTDSTTPCIRTHVQAVPLNPYSCTGGMTPSVQMYTPDGSTRTTVQPASVQMYSCAAGPIRAAQLCGATHSRCTAVLTISQVLGRPLK
jgi:hypothetical protein